MLHKLFLIPSIMKKKLLLFVLYLFIFQCQLSAQNLLDGPWSKKELNKSPENISFKEQTNSFNAYWENKDINQKGNGYKPFKRWEYHWRNYVQEDGTLPNGNELWSLFEQKQLISQNAESNWTSIGPWNTLQSKGQGRVNTFIVDPNNPEIYYVGTPAGGIWKSEDAGLNWTPLSDYIPQIGVSAIAIDPNNSQIIYIGTGDDDGGDSIGIGIMKSIDGGVTWKRTNSNTSMDYWVGEIYIHPQNSNVLWASSRRGFFKSTDAGENWVQILLGNQTVNENFAVKDIKLKPGDPEVIYAVSYSAFWKSTNGGNSFTKIKTGLPNTSNKYAIAVSPANPDLVYVLRAAEDSSFGGLYKSLDSGESFTKTQESSLELWGPGAQSYYDMEICVSPVDPDIVDIGAVIRYRSKDGGNSIESTCSFCTPTHVDVHYLGYFNNVLYEGNDGGIYQLIGNELGSPSSWKNLTNGLAISQVYKLTVAKSADMFPNVIAGLQDNGGFSFNTFSWSNWVGSDGMDNAMHPTNENLFFSFRQNGDQLNISEDGGLTRTSFLSKPNGETGYWVTPLQMDEDGILWTAFSGGIYYANGAYNNWFKKTLNNIYFGIITNMEMARHPFQSSNNVMFISNTENRIFKSYDRGQFFIPIDSPKNLPPNIALSSIEIFNGNPNIVYITYSDGNIFRSVDGGENWVSIRKNLGNIPIFVIKHQEKSMYNDLYIGTHLGVFYTNFMMDKWERFDNNLPNTPVKDLEINIENNTITAGTYGRGVWVSPLATSTVLSVSFYENNNSIIYPNPTNEQISIKLKDNQKINEIQVFDVLGQRIQSIRPINNLVDVKFLKSGWYIVVIKTDEGVITKKVLVQK